MWTGGDDQQQHEPPALPWTMQEVQELVLLEALDLVLVVQCGLR